MKRARPAAAIVVGAAAIGVALLSWIARNRPVASWTVDGAVLISNRGGAPITVRGLATDQLIQAGSGSAVRTVHADLQRPIGVPVGASARIQPAIWDALRWCDAAGQPAGRIPRFRAVTLYTDRGDLLCRVPQHNPVLSRPPAAIHP